MTPVRSTAHRLLGGAAAAVLAAAIGLTLHAPRTAAAATVLDPPVWGNAQAWAANGDAVSGYSAAVGFDGDNEEHGDIADRHGLLAPYLEIEGSSHAAVGDGGAVATTTVDSAVLRLTVTDLMDLGLIEVPVETGADAPEPLPPAEDGEGDEDDGGVESAEDEGERFVPYSDPSTPGTEGTPRPHPWRPPVDEDGPNLQDERRSPAPTDLWSPFPSPSESPTDGVISLDDALIRRISADNTLEISVTDVVTTASAGYDGHTGTRFEHGALSAFGVTVDPLRPGRAQVVEDVLEVMDEEGRTVLEVPVAVHFARIQESFDDEDPDWQGKGSRSRLNVTVHIGGTGGEGGFSVDFADSWALGSTYAAGSGSPPSADGENRTTPQAQQHSGGSLALTGSSLAALATAALVAIGGGSTATFLARKRTSAMDDRIGD